ncbi:multicopper oxidase family protein [Nitratiruptor tergarcus]|uniref:Multicopper oxidase with three cupredoxin domains (Includes cell division protein FtsP and spore coat protein CotA) n=1 Tax=Nitratiruptor tergarcus DSM 16512 TaxID=1069081 RepID=A0A1W1WTV0_9BACT|nr:multicopper oxidase domain-containing protein [Nitratiruptor tergarcus]SMC09707.1 Multicopper oxidase with three cupredoxin domains (includes cell division protein FtsP and spore coat protein CotA) [Nitratiruptor tergarcus DSM 16512]
MKRRDFLKLSGFAPIGIMGYGWMGHGWMGRRHSTNSNILSLKPKKSPLPIPKLLDPIIENGIKKFHLNIQESHHTFFENINTKTYGIESTYLGPTLLLRQGESVEIEYKNNLPEATTMHGHGMHVPAIMDGGVHQVINPNQCWSAKYTVNQPASTCWYHPHLMGKTAEQVYMGLAGMIIVEDEESKNLNIPQTYGVDDIPVVLQDKKFDSSGQIDYSPTRMEIKRGYKANTFLVNGAIEPYFNAKTGWLRLRVLNGANARVFTISFGLFKSFYQIATDNSFLEQPIKLNSLTLSPGERAEIVVYVDRDLVLQDRNTSKSLLYIFKDESIGLVDSLPTQLTNLERLNIHDAKRVRRFVLNMRRGHMAINSKIMNKNRIDERVPVNDVEIWEIINPMHMVHNFHIHATHFEIIERNGSARNVLPSERGFKDTIYMPPRSTAKVLVKMKDYVDEVHPYMYHCHILEHEDDGMMGQFTVVSNS